MKKFWKELNFSSFDVLYIYGKVSFEPFIFKWLSQKKERALVIIDEEGFLPPHPQIFVISGTEEELKTLCWNFVFLRSHFCFSPALNKEQKQRGQKVGELLSHLEHGIHLVASEYSDFGSRCWKNTQAHLVQGVRILEEGAENCFKGIPAIICGGGPSLSQHLSLLQNLQDRSLIFSGGSSLAALTPHLAAHVDPTLELHRFFNQCPSEVPFFYQTRVSSDLLKCIHAPQFLLRGTQNSLLEDWLLGCPQSSREWGWSVVTFLTHLAYLFGCDPIIFVGCDFAAVGKKLYAKEAAASQEGCISFKNEAGELMTTKRDWLMSSHFLSQFIAKHSDRLWINTSSSGIPIKGAQIMPLSHVSLSQTYDLKGLVHMVCQTLPVQEMRVELEPFQQTLTRCKAFCKELLHYLESCFTHRKIPPPYIVTQLDLESEPLFTLLLEPNWKIWKPIFGRHFDLDDPYTCEIQKIIFYQSVINAYV
jgi:hypothetical protein